MIIKRTYQTLATASLCLISSITTHAGTMGIPASNNVYFSAFVGGGGLTGVYIKQQGTGFLADNLGGPIVVNAQGKMRTSSVWMVGGHAGYQGRFHPLNNVSSKWSIAPSSEIEGYYIGNSKLQGHDLNNSTSPLPTEHDFLNTYPMDIGVFLINGVAHFKHDGQPTLHPYIGLGFGAAILSISNATSIQTSPEEPGINHYNTGTHASNATFAAQPKIGLAYDLNETTKVFAEYRLLCLASSQYVFGSTGYLTHVATSPWNVSLSSHLYNFGTLGIHYDA